MQQLLIIVIQQHGDDWEFVFFFGQGAGQGLEALAALGLQFIAGTQARFEQGCQTLGDYFGNILITGDDAFFKFDLVLTGNTVEGGFLHRVD